MKALARIFSQVSVNVVNVYFRATKSLQSQLGRSIIRPGSGRKGQ